MAALPAESAPDAAVLQAVDRAIAELRRGGLIVLWDRHGEAGLVQAAEGTSEQGLARLRELSRGSPRLLLTAQRAAALGISGAAERLPGAGIVSLELAATSPRVICELADPTSGRSAPSNRPEMVYSPAGLDSAAIDLAKLARLLPAALLATIDHATDPSVLARQHDLLEVSAREIEDYRYAVARSLEIVSEARVPLEGAENSQVYAFRPSDGGFEHLAVVIGEPAADRPVLTRLHSECFTGDLLGSLRCDCGDQLRGAIRSISEAGSGVLLYLAQEGRGIGLANKLRAYQLQDRGADTIDANQQLGFDADERVYLPAAEMLRQLGFGRVRLLTNNPEKVAALTRCGIVVEERVPHAFPSNTHNDFYLATKASRFGHLF
jgi:GTP cyclohydrolase II